MNEFPQSQMGGLARRAVFRIFLLFQISTVVLMTSLCAAQEEASQTGPFEIRDTAFGGETRGSHSFSAVVLNRTDDEKMLVLDLRTEAIGLGMTNWQRQFYYRFRPTELRTIGSEYQVLSPLLTQTVLRFGEASNPDDADRWASLPLEKRPAITPPKVTFFYREVLPPKTSTLSGGDLAKVRPEHGARAREVFREEFPYFEDLDPVRVTPLIAPVPLLVITGAQDEQFKPEGVVEDQAVQQAYRPMPLSFLDLGSNQNIP